MVKAACHRILGDAGLAEDAAQEVFLLLVRKLPSLPPHTILGGWLYITACQLARTHQRSQARRRRRENEAETMGPIMTPTENNLWHELEPLLDDAMLSLSQRQRELMLFRYFQNRSQRAAASLVGCSESVASRELAAAIEKLRGFFTRQGVSISATALVMLLGANAARASITGGGMAATLSSASAPAGTSAVGNSLLLTLMNGATITKIIAAAAALLIISGAVHHFTRPDIGSVPAGQPALESNRISGGGEFSQTKAENPKALASVSRQRPQASGP